MEALAQKYDEIKKLECEYCGAFKEMCLKALEENGLNGEVSVTSVLGIERKGKMYVLAGSSIEMPYHFEFVSYAKDGDGRPVYQEVFYPTAPFFNVHEGKAEFSDMSEYVKKYVAPKVKATLSLS